MSWRFENPDDGSSVSVKADDLNPEVHVTVTSRTGHIVLNAGAAGR